MKLMGVGATVVLSCQLFGQAAPHPPAFEVASVKRVARPAGRGLASVNNDPGRIYYAGFSLKDLLMRAYEVMSYQVSGPSWLDSEYYEVGAKVPEGAPEEQIPVMLQNLLAERFQMTVRRETRVQSAYALVVGKEGPKLKKSENPAAPTFGMRTKDGALSEEFTGFTLADFAKRLTVDLGRPVFDLTKIEGSYDIRLELDPDNRSGSILPAVKNIGLALESRDMPVEYVVIEKAEKVPTEN